MTAVGQMPDVFTPDECLWVSSLPLPASLAEITEGGGPGTRLDYQRRRTLEREVPRNREFSWIYQRLRKLALEANERAYRFKIGDLMTMHVLEYSSEGFFDWHMDLGAGPTASRKLSMVTFLTPPGDYEGGDLRFMDGSEALRPAQGTTAIFPSYLLHKVDPVSRGTRHTLVSWLHGPCFS